MEFEKLKSVEKDDFVLVDIPKYAGDWPQLCLVLAHQNDNLWCSGMRVHRQPYGIRVDEKFRLRGEKKEPGAETTHVQQIWSSVFKHPLVIFRRK